MWIAVFILLYFLLPRHTHHYKTKEDKVYFEHVIFKVEWSVDYFVIKKYGKAFCLLCNDMPNCAERIQNALTF